MRDFSKTPIQDLRRIYARHAGDTGTKTMTEECRRMAILDAAGAELQRRGEPLPKPDHHFWHDQD